MPSTGLDRLGRIPVEKTKACRVESKYVALLHGRKKKQRECSDYPGSCSFLPAPPRLLSSSKDTPGYSRKPWNLHLTTSRNRANRPTSHSLADSALLKPLLAIIEGSPATEVLKHKPNPVVYKSLTGIFGKLTKVSDNNQAKLLLAILNSNQTGIPRKTLAP